ncbi:MAG: uracil-DNA glycosylase [gamma proteobacterium symbiont of Lucinoma myriamae]|nr:uracil-DNA glycosylase [gamma proteobacterium symbiont of Lucinoma myriamae]MCU7818311.1 uracil-DNA glycosylase [gamma proteobacterium symbiont of Lucinoma myriamae]MCU7832413.1 uracil-DNA glycosylase [gamma proteobacterium symbiont of Lucinoma myriamae]
MNNSLRQQYLDAIGIQSWKLNTALDDSTETETVHPADELISEPEALLAQEPQPYQEPQLYKDPQADPETQQSVIRSKSVSSNQYTDSEKSKVAPVVLNNEATIIQVNDSTHNESQSELIQSINHCKKCTSRNTRLNAIAGQGSDTASVFIISGAPNAQEDRLGHYLVGQSQSLFQAMLNSVGFINNYFFTGLIKCYSLSSFRFSEQDIENCRPYLHSQIMQINPSVLFVLGAAEAQTLLNSSQSFNELRGKIHHVMINDTDYSVIVSYHPAYLLRNPLYKKESLNDLIMVKNLIK